MASILAYEKVESGKIICGFVEDDNKYKRFEATARGVEFSDEYEVGNYKDYLHFVGVMSKFDPYTFFLKKPITVPEITYESLLSAIE